MSSLAGALDLVEQEPKNEPPLEDVDMIAQDMFADEGTEEPKVQDEEMQDLFGEGDENVEEIKHNEYVYHIGNSRPVQWFTWTKALQRQHRHHLSMPTGSTHQSGGIERLWSMLRRRRKNSQQSRYSSKPLLQYRTSQCPEAQTRTYVTRSCPCIRSYPFPPVLGNPHAKLRESGFQAVPPRHLHRPRGRGRGCAGGGECAREKYDHQTQGGEHCEVAVGEGRERARREHLCVLALSAIINPAQRRQSNARIVRWSDGTLSLLLGKELFDITQTIDTSGAVPRQAFGPGTQSQPSSQSQSQPQSQGSAGPSKSQGLTYLVAQHKRAEILQSEALITGYMSLRPTGMQSSTHRMLVRAVGQKHTKVARLRMAPDPVMDPEREKMELMKAASRKPRRPRGEGDEGFGTRRRRSGYTRRRTGEEMWSDEDEEEAGYGGGASEDEYGDDSSAKKRRKSEKDDAKKGPGEYQTDDFLVADSDEDADAYGSDDDGAARKRSKRHREARDGEEDELERMEKQMEEERRRRKDSGDGEEDGMDVESEEEDEGGAVRKRTAGGSRKKRAIEMEEEEEEE